MNCLNFIFIGIPYVVLIGNASARKFSERPVVEFFKMDSSKTEPVALGLLTHSELFDRINNIFQ